MPPFWPIPKAMIYVQDDIEGNIRYHTCGVKFSVNTITPLTPTALLNLDRYILGTVYAPQ